jgi:Cu/Ag efflux protein CusF
MKVTGTMLAIAIGTALIGAAPLAVQAQQGAVTTGVVAVAPGAAAAVETTRTAATVVGIDAANRVVALRGQDGKVFNVTAGEEVRNFAQIGVGDVVKAEHTKVLTLELQKRRGGMPGRTEKESLTRAPLGAKPSASAGRQVTILADVDSVDTEKGIVTLRNAQGDLIDLPVQNRAQLRNISKGDQVEAVYTEALAVSVETQPQGAPK